VHDAGELAAGLAKLLFGFAHELRVRRSAVEHEHASDRFASELLADAVGGVERLERSATAQKSKGPG
jgi:hypothetical protein